MNINKLTKLLRNPYLMVIPLSRIGLTNFLPDSIYLKIRYRATIGKKLHLKRPRTFNEKLQWLKLHDRNPIYTNLVDKLLVRDYVARVIGEEYLIPLLGVWEDPDEIDFSSLPKQFVLKCNHNSALGLCLCTDKCKLDFRKVRKELKKGLKKNFYYKGREWPYKNIQRRIIAEQMMIDESGYELKDYKFFCFQGEPKFLYVASDRNKTNEEVKFDFFDLEWNHLPVINGHPHSANSIPKPKNLDAMIKVSQMLSKGFSHVRVDLYNINGRIYFGELTFRHLSGFTPFEPVEWDYEFGDYLDITQIT